jgi:enediyne biosynthesis protein E3
MNTALQKTEAIKTVFLETQLFYAKHDDLPALIIYLANTEKEFSSIAYESASMAIALKNFEADTFPHEWLLFASGAAAAHHAQVYVGLGWAIAKFNFPFLTAVKKLDPRFYFRIADGCGYYDGSFKYRRTITNKELPVYLPTAAMPMYDQGLGRSIWYTEKADIHKMCSRVETFAAIRHADLWRGVGIAVAYVGGCDDADLKTLLQLATINGFQLACGAALAARSRTKANTMTADTNRCSRLWFTLAVDDAVIINEDVYCGWIKEIEEKLAAGFEGINNQ